MLPTTNGRKTLAEQVYDHMKESIVTLKLEPGRMVYENELAISLGASRTPIREALKRLSTDRLIEVLPQRGTQVAFISEMLVKEAAFVRRSLEISAFVHVAKHWDNESTVYTASRLRMERLLWEQNQALAIGDSERFLQADEAFHREVHLLANNSILMGIVDQMQSHLHRLRYLTLQDQIHMERLIKEHEQMLQHMQEGRTDSLIEVLTQHLSRLEVDLPLIRQKHPAYFTN